MTKKLNIYQSLVLILGVLSLKVFSQSPVEILNDNYFLLINKETGRYMGVGNSYAPGEDVDPDETIFYIQTSNTRNLMLKNMNTNKYCRGNPSVGGKKAMQCNLNSNSLVYYYNENTQLISLSNTSKGKFGQVDELGTQVYCFHEDYDISGYSGNNFRWEPMEVQLCESGKVFSSLDNLSCLSTCPDGQNKGDYLCLNCEVGCKKCDDNFDCLVCDDGYYFKNGECVNEYNNQIVSITAQRGEDYCSIAYGNDIVRCDHTQVGNTEKFKIVATSGGYVFIIAESNNRYCRAIESSKGFACNSTADNDNSKWSLVWQGGNSYALLNKKTNLYVETAQKRKRKNGKKKHKYYYLMTNSQQIEDHSQKFDINIL